MTPIRAFMSATGSPGIRCCASVIGYSSVPCCVVNSPTSPSPRLGEQNTTMVKSRPPCLGSPAVRGCPGLPAPGQAAGACPDLMEYVWPETNGRESAPFGADCCHPLDSTGPGE